MVTSSAWCVVLHHDERVGYYTLDNPGQHHDVLSHNQNLQQQYQSDDGYRNKKQHNDYSQQDINHLNFKDNDNTYSTFGNKHDYSFPNSYSSYENYPFRYHNNDILGYFKVNKPRLFTNTPYSPYNDILFENKKYTQSSYSYPQNQKVFDYEAEVETLPGGYGRNEKIDNRNTQYELQGHDYVYYKTPSDTLDSDISKQKHNNQPYQYIISRQNSNNLITDSNYGGSYDRIKDTINHSESLQISEYPYYATDNYQTDQLAYVNNSPPGFYDNSLSRHKGTVDYTYRESKSKTGGYGDRYGY